MCLVSRERNRYNTGKGDEIPVELRKTAEYIGLEYPEVWQGEERRRIEEHYRPGWISQFDFAAILEWYGVDPSYGERVLEEARWVKEDPMLEQAVYAMYETLFFSASAVHQTIWEWKATFADHGSPMLCTLSLLCGQPIHQEVMERKAFDEEQVRLHKEEVRKSLYSERDVYGVDGIRFTLMIWCSIFMRGDILSCGRLQCEIMTEVPAKLKPHLQPEDVCAYLHIPGGSKLEEAEVEAALKQAAVDVRRYFPQTKGRRLVFCTQTWLLSPELAPLLSQESNIMKFQRRFRIVDTIPGNGPFLDFLFRAPGETHCERLPEDTFLRRQVKKCLLEGQQFQMGVGIVKEEKCK